MKEKVFINSNNLKICGILSNPTDNFSKPIIILVHGFSSNKNGIKFKTFEEILNRNDIATIRVDLFAHGESEGKFEGITYSKAVQNILDTINYLKNLGYKKIGLLGSSFGGLSSIMAASKTNDLFCLTLLVPVSNHKEKKIKQLSKKQLEDWKNKGFMNYKNSTGEFKLSYNLFKDYDNNNGYVAAEKINIPTLIIHGDKDNEVPLKQSIKTASIIRNCKLEIIKNTGHKFQPEEKFNQMIKLATDFIIKHCN
ncbi:MAG: alpha/beta fold hydrolase [Nanoarchaeota archaeon]|nr:alpha/beta fold hydrolase [Nanoarchaeota archaeon]